MALIIIVIIMVIGLGIVGSLYASINPFVYKLGSITTYSSAYYGAVMSVERGLLALRYHDAGFEGESGINTGSASDSMFSHSFGSLTSGKNINTSWRIQSRTMNSIPATGNGNIEALFSTGDSKNFNSLGYYEGLEIPLYLDNTALGLEYYDTPLPANINSVVSVAGTLNIRGTFRLPPKIKAGLQDEALDDTVDVDSDTILDDVIVNRGWKGNDILEGINFNIIPTIRQNFALFQPIYEFDNALRESIINEGETTENINTEAVAPNDFGFHFNIPGNTTNSLLDEHNILPLSSQQTGSAFETILNDNNITGLTLNFNIINRMRTNGGNIYPFLERRLKACDLGGCNNGIILPSQFFTILGSTTIGGTTVNITIKKPVRETSNTSNFTIIF